MNEQQLKELSSIVSERIGHTIAAEHIQTDESGWYYYLPAKSLKQGYPLILNHYRGMLFMVIPVDDSIKIEKGEITILEYVNSSVWSFGYFWGGGSIIKDVHWQPLEEKGINDKKKIRRYLTILGCRTCKQALGYMPTAEYCASCDVEKCPFSQYSFKSQGASWDNEIKEKNIRLLFFKAVKNQVKMQFGLDAIGCCNHDKDEVSIYPTCYNNRVMVDIPTRLFIDIMCQPQKFDIEEIVKGLDIHIKSNHCVSKITPEMDIYECLKKEFPEIMASWHVCDKQHEEKVQTNNLKKVVSKLKKILF